MAPSLAHLIIGVAWSGWFTYAQTSENEDESFRLEHVMYCSFNTHLRNRI